MREALLNIDKSPGPTSFDVIRELKKADRTLKVGHTGSLDPFASGVLILLVGRATKLSQHLLNADKRYFAKVKLGQATDSMDLTGEVVENKPVPELTAESVDAVLQSFQGTWEQLPPMYSAKKVHGVRLYELARQQIKVRRAPIPVSLYELKLLKLEGESFEFEVFCSKGTYVRSLADELGRRLGTVGHLTELRRLSCGPFPVEESESIASVVADLPGALERGYRNYLLLLERLRFQKRRAAEYQVGLS